MKDIIDGGDELKETLIAEHGKKEGMRRYCIFIGAQARGDILTADELAEITKGKEQ